MAKRRAPRLDLQLDLAGLPECDGWRQQLEQCIEAGDGFGFALWLCPEGAAWVIDYVVRNHELLAARGAYEAAVVHAFTCARWGNYAYSVKYLEAMFGLADRARLLSAGDPMPAGERFTIFRGVAGRGAARRARGFSWTESKQTAAWFAIRNKERGDPGVYEAVVDRSDVLFFCEREREFVVRPAKVKRVPMSDDELRAAFAREVRKNRVKGR